jgi:hypothetical protein
MVTTRSSRGSTCMSLPRRRGMSSSSRKPRCMEPYLGGYPENTHTCARVRSFYNTQFHTHIHTHSHTHTHTHTHTHSHTRTICTHAHIDAYTHTRSRTHMLIHTSTIKNKQHHYAHLRLSISAGLLCIDSHPPPSHMAVPI